MVRVRFAPSPTGPIHIGGVRTALYNYLYKLNKKGKFVLRIEDTDCSRKVKGAEKYIYDVLDYYKIKVDEGPREGGGFGPYRQSERRKIYNKYINLLIYLNVNICNSGWTSDGERGYPMANGVDWYNSKNADPKTRNQKDWCGGKSNGWRKWSTDPNSKGSAHCCKISKEI